MLQQWDDVIEELRERSFLTWPSFYPPSLVSNRINIFEIKWAAFFNLNITNLRSSLGLSVLHATVYSGTKYKHSSIKFIRIFLWINISLQFNYVEVLSSCLIVEKFLYSSILPFKKNLWVHMLMTFITIKLYSAFSASPLLYYTILICLTDVTSSQTHPFEICSVTPHLHH